MKSFKSVNKDRAERKVMILYVVTLAAGLLAAAGLMLGMELKGAHIPIYIAGILLTAGLHFVVFVFIALWIDRLRDGNFQKEYNKIMEKYQTDDDAEALYNKLVNMQNNPNTDNAKNAYYFSLSTAAMRTGRNQEAMDYVRLVVIKSERVRALVDEQIKKILSIKEKKTV